MSRKRSTDGAVPGPTHDSEPGCSESNRPAAGTDAWRDAHPAHDEVGPWAPQAPRYWSFDTGEGRLEVQLPTVVEIEVNTHCNRSCSYCPVSTLPPPPGSKFMDEGVFGAVIDRLTEIEFDGRLSYHFYSEPLLYRGLESLVAVAHERLPRAVQVIYTNGDLLGDARYESLLEVGVAGFVVTQHDNEDYPYRERQRVLLAEQLNLSNRGGSVGPRTPTLDLPCYAPAEMLIVTATGDVLLCYEDAHRDHVMGNLLDQSLLQVWSSRRFTRLRERLAAADRGATELCQGCDNRAHAKVEHTWFAL